MYLFHWAECHRSAVACHMVYIVIQKKKTCPTVPLIRYKLYIGKNTLQRSFVYMALNEKERIHFIEFNLTTLFLQKEIRIINHTLTRIYRNI